MMLVIYKNWDQNKKLEYGKIVSLKLFFNKIVLNKHTVIAIYNMVTAASIVIYNEGKK